MFSSAKNLKKYKKLYGDKDDMFINNLICPDKKQLQTSDPAKELTGQRQ